MPPPFLPKYWAHECQKEAKVMATVLVTGAAGFIGSHTVDRLLLRGEQVIGVDNFDPLFYGRPIKERNLRWALSQPNFTFVTADICDGEAMCQLFERYRPQKVIHLAALAGVVPSLERPVDYDRVNVLGTTILLDLARRYGVEMFVFGSSSSVYGADTKAPFREDAPAVKPISPYGATKRMGEILAFTFHHLFGLNITCLRFFTVYGPRQRPDLAIHKFARCILQGEPVPIYGDGTSQRDYTYIDDIVDGILAALDKPMGYEIINLGCGEPVVLLRVVELLERALGKKAKLQFLPMPPTDPPLTHADITKARKLLGYEPKVRIDEGVPRFVEWFLREGHDRP
jgi:UDP-glucuronate 4-epimerase